MQVTRVGTGYYQKSFGANLCKRVEDAILKGQERYANDPAALAYYNKRAEDVRTIRPGIDVVVHNQPGAFLNFYGEDLVYLQKGTRTLGKPMFDIPLHCNDLDVEEIACLDGITALYNSLNGYKNI